MPKIKPIRCIYCGKKKAFLSVAPNGKLLNHDQLGKKWYFCGKCMTYFQKEAI